MGRPSKPTALKVIQGNAGKRKLNAKEPKPQAEILKPPTNLCPYGTGQFNHYAKLLGESKITTSLDYSALLLLVSAEVEFFEYNEILANDGLVQETTNTNGDIVKKAHPMVPARADCFRRIKLMLTEFGLTPASRAKVNAETETDEGDLNDKYGV